MSLKSTSSAFFKLKMYFQTEKFDKTYYPSMFESRIRKVFQRLFDVPKSF